jgi:hypothetical protein
MVHWALTRSLPEVNPDSVNDSGNISQQCKDDIDPKMETDADLQENTQGWKND